MKKYLHTLALAAVAAAAVCCTSAKEWSEKEREQLRESIEDYREMVYLENLSDIEFQLFADDVVLNAETAYPIYATLTAMPAMSDTVDVWVISGVAEQLDEDAENMRHIFPYNKMIKDGILPKGLDHQQRKAFYKCLAGKVNSTYINMYGFISALIDSPAVGGEIEKMQKGCAEDLFDWSVNIEVEQID